MFPTEAIERYIRLSSSKSIEELARVRAREVAEARRKLPNKSGMRLRAIMQPSVNFTKSRIDCWIQIVRDACKEANRPVDNEVRSYMLTEVHNMCEAAKKHTAQALALMMQQEGMQQIPRVQESLSAQFDHQISQIESEIRRDLKLEELREDVQKNAAPLQSAPLSEKVSPVTPPVYHDLTLPPVKTGHKWTGFEKWTTFLTAIVIVIGGLTLCSSHEFRVWAHIEHPVKSVPISSNGVDPTPQTKPELPPTDHIPKPTSISPKFTTQPKGRTPATKARDAAPLLADIRIAIQEPNVSTNPEFPYALKAIIQTNISIEPVAFDFECDGEIGEAKVWEGSGPQSYTMEYYGIVPTTNHVYRAAWKTPAFTPDQPLTVMIYSKQQVKLLAVRKIKYEWPF